MRVSILHPKGGDSLVIKVRHPPLCGGSIQKIEGSGKKQGWSTGSAESGDVPELARS